jgi:hypothetical protein
MNRLKYAAPLLITLAVFLTVGSSLPASNAQGKVIPAASMHARRADHTATLLPGGRVLIAGGMVENGVFLDSAELFDPAKQTFVSAANMQSRRVGHSATLLPNGKVLIAGGLAGRVFEGGPGIVASTEIFDPATGRFSAGPSMTTPRSAHGAILLANKKVLFVGGVDGDERPLASAEIYDPATNRFTAVASMHTARVARGAVLLHDGRVLVTGGGNGRGPALSSAEVFDPRTSSWISVGDMTSPREKHSAAVLADGRILITGGSADGDWHPVKSAEVFDPHTNKFTTVSEMEMARFKFPDAAVTLQDGRVLVAGGATDVEVYDASAGRFSRVGTISEPNYFASATRLADGRVLIAGGYNTGRGRSNGPLSSDRAWIYQP